MCQSEWNKNIGGSLWLTKLDVRFGAAAVKGG